MSVFVRYFNVYKKIWFGRKLGKIHIERSPSFEIKVPGRICMCVYCIVYVRRVSNIILNYDDFT